MTFKTPGLILLCLSSAIAQSGFPLHEETLNYSVNWPSELSLGEAHLHAVQVKSKDGTAEKWRFEFSVDAAVPGFAVQDRYQSTATSGLCSLNLDKNASHGKRKTNERITFDRAQGTVKRATRDGGGKSEYSVPDCAKDALTFLYYVREELSQGRVPPSQAIVFGAQYQARLEYTGPQSITVNDKRMDADRVAATLKGPSSDVSFEMFFARDPARTPLAVRVPLPLGTFSMELVR